MSGMFFHSLTFCSFDPLPDAAQPFPSPGSAFIPPPVPGKHEFALRRSSFHRKMSKKDVDDGHSCRGSTIPTTDLNGVAPTFPNGVVSHIDTRVPAPLSLLRSFVPRFIVSILNMPLSLWHAFQFQDPPSSPARDPPDTHPSASDPQLSLSPSIHRLSTQSVTSLTSSRPAPPSPAASRRTSGLSRSSSRPASGMSSTASSRPVSGVHHSRPVSTTGSRPISDAVQPITPITTTPTLPTVTTPRPPQDRRPAYLSTSHLDTTPAEPTPTTTHAATPSPATDPASIQIRDYGFAPTDPRFSGQGPHVPRANRPAILARRLAASSSTRASSSEGGDDEVDEEEEEEEDGEGEQMNVDVTQKVWEDVPDDGINGWGGFKWGGFGRGWGFGRMSGIASGPICSDFPSRGDLDRNFGGEDDYEDMEIDEESETMSDDGDVDLESEPPLVPGMYRALYAFEPEGTAEMKLEEDQLVRVIGRGGGLGWAVVVKDGLKDMGIHALVPESYLEPVRLEGEEGVRE